MCIPQANLCMAPKATLVAHTSPRLLWTREGTLFLASQSFHSVCHPEPAGSRLGQAQVLGYWETLRDLGKSDAYSKGKIDRISGWTGELVWTLVLHMVRCGMAVDPHSSDR